MNNQVTIDGMAGTILPNGMVRFGSDSGVNVLFYKKPVHDPVGSREKGRPVTIALDYVRIQQPGEKDFADRPVRDDPSVINRWPQHWARYQEGQQPIPDGTPIDILFPQNPEIAANLHPLGMHTIEQMAGATAHALQTIGMGSVEWQKKARDFLAAANGGVGMHKLQTELERRDNTIEVLQNEMSLLRRQIDQLLAVQQGIPSTMVPPTEPTQAQAAMVAAPSPQRSGWPKGKPRGPRKPKG